MSRSHKILVVGDLHVVPEELDDCTEVIKLILQTCRSQDIQEVLFTGDQHHTHAVLRLEVLNWWRIAFKALKAEGINSICLVGNHDQLSPGSSVHSMLAYEGLQGVKVVDQPTVHRGVLLLPYYHEEAEFVAACREHAPTYYGQDNGEDDDRGAGPGALRSGVRTVFCHQTFDGSTYENGFLASDGFDPNLIQQELIVSGHIHTGQEFGKVWYVGAPRWRSLSDANAQRAIWLLELEDGQLKNRIPYDTGDVCRQIKHLDDTPDHPVKLPLDLKHQWRIDIRGPLEWVESRKIALKAAGARVRPFPEQVSTIGRVKESEGVEKAFRTFLGSYQAKHGTRAEVLEAMAKEHLHV